MIKIKYKPLFFNTRKLRLLVDEAAIRSMSRFGAYVRTTARRSIRKRKKPSLPGKPPSSHTGLLKRFIWFGYDPARRSVAIGPAKLNLPGETPHVLEHGGRNVTTVKYKRKSGPKKSKRIVKVRPRPFMQPALEENREQLPKIFRDSIR
jgi:hypothetical protein